MKKDWDVKNQTNCSFSVSFVYFLKRLGIQRYRNTKFKKFGSRKSEFVVCYYGPIWFDIKFSPKCMKHLQHINFLQILEPGCESQNMAKNPKEFLLVSLWECPVEILADIDEKNTHTKKVIDKTKIREVTGNEEEIRIFRPPKLDKTAKNLTKILAITYNFAVQCPAKLSPTQARPMDVCCPQCYSSST